MSAIRSIYSLALLLLGMLASPVLAEFREFKNPAGDVIKAEIVSHKAGQIMLRREDGVEFEVDPTIFSVADQAYIKKWMEKNPATIDYNLEIHLDKKKVDSQSSGSGYYQTRKDFWSYVIEIKNNSQDSVQGLTIHYRVYYHDNYYSSSRPFQMVSGSVKVKDKLPFNRTLEVTTKPVCLDTYRDYGTKYSDELVGCLVRVTDSEGKVILDSVSNEAAMKGKTWEDIGKSGKPTGGGVIIK